MIIGLDLDGCLVDWDGHWRSIYQEWFNRPLGPGSGQWESPILDTHFVDWGEFWTWAGRVGPRFWSETPVIPGAQAAICELADKGVDFHLITNRPGTAYAPTLDLVNRVWPTGVYFRDVSLVRDTKTIIDCDVYIDDNPVRLDEFVAFEKRCVRMPHPWNEGHKVPSATWETMARRIGIVGKQEWSAFLKGCK